MKLPYAPASPPASAPEPTLKAYTQLSARRAPAPLQPLDLALLHAPALASGWSSFLGAIRTATSLPPDIRELCICRIAAVNQAEYEWAHHVPLLREAGVGEEAVEMLKHRKAWAGWELHEEDDGGQGGEVGTGPGGLSDRQCSVLAYADAMTVGIKVPDGIFRRLKEGFNEQEIVEITGTVAAYNCVSRFLVALDVGELEEKKKDGEGRGDSR